MHDKVRIKSGPALAAPSRNYSEFNLSSYISHVAPLPLLLLAAFHLSLFALTAQFIVFLVCSFHAQDKGVAMVFRDFVDGGPIQHDGVSDHRCDARSVHGGETRWEVPRPKEKLFPLVSWCFAQAERNPV